MCWLHFLEPNKTPIGSWKDFLVVFLHVGFMSFPIVLGESETGSFLRSCCVCLWVLLLHRNLTTLFGCLDDRLLFSQLKFGVNDCCQTSVEMFKRKGNRLGFCWYDKILQWWKMGNTALLAAFSPSQYFTGENPATNTCFFGREPKGNSSMFFSTRKSFSTQGRMFGKLIHQILYRMVKNSTPPKSKIIWFLESHPVSLPVACWGSFKRWFESQHVSDPEKGYPLQKKL